MICVGYLLLMAQYFKMIFLHTCNQLSVGSKTETILTLAGQSQRLCHMYTRKISGVFNGNRTHDLCDAVAVILKLINEATRMCM